MTWSEGLSEPFTANNIKQTFMLFENVCYRMSVFVLSEGVCVCFVDCVCWQVFEEEAWLRQLAD